MKGILYGVGVGPGDPELLTYKAARVLREADVIAVPGGRKEDAAAYQIAVAAVPEIAEKECLEIAWPMTKQEEILQENYARAAARIEAVLDAQKSVAFLTLGDPTVYSTYLYVHRLAGRDGYQTQIISGVPSFCAAAARLNEGLVEKSEMLHIVPASYQIEEALGLPGTRVLMKAGKKIGDVKRALLQTGVQAATVENCGMPGEKCFFGAQNIPEDAGYYTLLIVKDGPKAQG